MAIAHTKPEESHTRTRKTQVPTELMHELKEVAAQKLKVEGSHADVLDAVIEFLIDDKTPTIATSVESIGSTLNWFTLEVERLRQQVQELTIERDQARQQKQDDGEVEALRTENEQLRTELAQFQQLKQMLVGSGAPMTQPATVVAPPDQPITPAPRQKRVTDDEQALAPINQAIDAMMAWNDQPEKKFEHKWYISIPVLQQLLRGSGFSASQPRVQAAIDHRREELDNHHLKHNLGSRHNRLHLKSITEDVAL